MPPGSLLDERMPAHEEDARSPRKAGSGGDGSHDFERGEPRLLSPRVVTWDEGGQGGDVRALPGRWPTTDIFLHIYNVQ